MRINIAILTFLMAGLPAFPSAHPDPAQTDLTRDRLPKLVFTGNTAAELYTREIEESFKGVLKYNFISTPGEGYPVGFLRASIPQNVWWETLWTRDGGTHLRELAHWGMLEHACAVVDCLTFLVEKNEEGYYSFPQFFTKSEKSHGKELDGTSAIIIGMVDLWRALPVSHPSRGKIYSFLHGPGSPLQYIHLKLSQVPLLDGEGEFGPGCCIEGSAINVVQNNLCRLALLAGAVLEKANGDPTTAGTYASDAEKIRINIPKYLVNPDKTWLWCINPVTFKPDQVVLNNPVNLGAGLINGVACMSSDVLGLTPLETDDPYNGYNLNTFNKLYNTPLRKEQFDKYGIWPQFDVFRAGLSSGPSYGDGYALQTMLLYDKMDMADKSVSWMAHSTYQPVKEYQIERTSPYYFYERSYSPDAVGKVDLDYGCGPLNLVNVTEQLKVARLIVGVDDKDPDELRLVPRVPPSWTGYTATDWPVVTREGIARADISYSKTESGIRFQITVRGNRKFRKISVRLPSGSGWKWYHKRNCSGFTISAVNPVNPSGQSVERADTVRPSGIKPKVRSYTTVRLSTEKPKIDGILDDACWQTGDWAGDFTQWTPKEGARPSQPTLVKVLYDDKNIYAAIQALDSAPAKIHRIAGRRDEFQGDMAGINFDSYHDHRTGFEFSVTAAGQKIDLILTNPLEAETNWNAVWYVKVSHNARGWIAEYEIPLSQLRYSSEQDQVWGMHVWRWIDRLQEESDWEVLTSTGPGTLYQFGELRGISGLTKSRRLEVMPYSVGQLKTVEKEAENPFTRTGREWAGKIGLDAKIGLSSNFTLDLTVNPDFGQVEADPSVMNLTAFETFFEEKRPFFLEGKNIFDFEFDNSSIFYSRRIGQPTGFTPSTGADEFLKMPGNTTIYTAEKFSGKTSKGLTVGVIHSITASEKARISSPEGERSEAVTPLTSYSVGRIQQDFHQGNTVVGAIFTSTNRLINNPNFNDLNRGAYTGGIDLLHQWKDKKYFIEFKLIGSDIKGSTQAISDLQTSSARYYQRPDAGYLNFDTTRTELGGFGGHLRIGKGSKGTWRYSTELTWRSPGLDLNDIGFMQMADVVRQSTGIAKFSVKPVSVFRSYNVNLSEYNSWNFGGNYLGSGAILNLSGTFLNQWSFFGLINYAGPSLDTRILRGGEAMLMPASWNTNLFIHTDYSKRVAVGAGTSITTGTQNNYKAFNISSEISLKPVNPLRISLSANYSDNYDQLQYVAVKSFQDQKKYILASIDQKNLGLTFRIDYNITPELSIQYYGSPFASIGKYNDFKYTTAASAPVFAQRFAGFTDPYLMDNTYWLDVNDDKIMDFSIDNPDFSFCQFRSNLVAKWEYRPGSSIYFVWSNDQTGYIQPGDNTLKGAFRQLKNAFPNNVFLIKINYWFSI